MLNIKSLINNILIQTRLFSGAGSRSCSGVRHLASSFWCCKSFSAVNKRNRLFCERTFHIFASSVCWLTFSYYSNRKHNWVGSRFRFFPRLPLQMSRILMRFQGDRTDLVRRRKYQTTTSDSEVLSSFAGRIRRVAAVEKKLNLCIQSYSSGSHFLVFEIHPRNIPSRSPASFLAPYPWLSPGS